MVIHCRIIIAIFILRLTCSFTSVQAQAASNKNDDRRLNSIIIDTVSVRANKLTVDDILDSMLFHSRTNYRVSSSLHLTLNVSLYNDTDTFFNCIVSSFLVRPLDKMKLYLLMIKSKADCNVVRRNLDKYKASMIMPYGGFPKTPIQTYLADIKSRASGCGKFREYNREDGQFSIIVRYNHAPRALFVRKNVDSQNAEIIYFSILVISRKDWALQSEYTVAVQISKATYDKFFSAFNYNDAFSIIKPVLNDESAKHFSSEITFVKANNLYNIGHVCVENNLYLPLHYSSDRFAGRNSVTYRYSMSHFEDVEVDVHGLEIFNIRNLIKSR